MLLANVPITVINRTYSSEHKLISFADTNTLLEICDKFQRPFLHFWTTEQPTLILGINDRHLPNLAAGLKGLAVNHYDYFLRNSGGLAVISDPKVLNVSLFIPTATHNYSIDQAYQIVADLIQTIFPSLTIAVHEIANSYCPGKFDLSVNGQKIAGIAQRRTQRALVLMLYMSIAGDQDGRSDTVAQFYEQGDAYRQDRWHFPKVDKATMTTLANLVSLDISVEAVEDQITTALAAQENAIDLSSAPELLRSAQFINEQATQLKKIQLRNNQLPIV